MKKEKLINAFMEFVGEKFPELIEEEQEETGFSDGDHYYYIDPDYNSSRTIWADAPIDEKRLLIGNAFKTEGEAKFAIEKLKVLHELESLGRPFDYGWSNYYFAFDYYNEEISIDFKSDRNHCFFSCFFNSEEDARQAVEKIGEYRIKKYLFGVE
ncbi:hypothetical protein R0V13_01345 [Facklamia hominis]|uniref:hypothetical protein n=1 Tax=Facklamia hominis TaxID=178214 RepID=UPI0029D416B9|nr:hypothetical protein [Facklamia hominis]WPJ91062.1 hypothetical protein R0V13_01345 [Facklamia hominis]